MSAKERIKDIESAYLSRIGLDDSLWGKGGSFLITRSDRGKIFSREDFSDEQQMFFNAVSEFSKSRILPVTDKIDKFDKDLSISLFKQMGELGFLGVDVPEKYGGSGLDKTTSCIIVDALSAGSSASMLVTASAHTGIATLPIIWYGTEEQKQKYLPKLASGEWMGCYALTEPNAGSDALAGETRAELSDDGAHYILNGQKIYITNASWADICVTFAKVDGKYTSFIIEKGTEGFSVGAEERKMGIKGSSTATLYFENCMVPVENMLGKLGQGGPIAFNVLYSGRYKLGMSTGAGVKHIVNYSLEFASNRKQFNKSISSFGMIQKKFANMIRHAWESETVVYMTSGSIDHAISGLDENNLEYYDMVQKIIEDHGIEASISKIVGSEALWYGADEGVQIHGGAGFIEEYKIAGAYRDERINRIFEGTNEINRLIISGNILKKAILDEVPIREMIAIRKDSWIPELDVDSSVLDIARAIEMSRSIVVAVLHSIIVRYGQDFKNEQWVIEPFADIVISLCVMDSCFKRYNHLKSGPLKDAAREVLELSTAERYRTLLENSRHIALHIGDKSLDSEIDKWSKNLSYRPDIILIQKKIYKTLEMYGEYYLDKEVQ